ncbi:conserved hypothetical protein [Frankia canadensis]|uniref:FAS1-like dehydratase domain-containing protein n=1 Tax=Frankia canadensis TaxID=1836972 RepID=A0A2I2KNE2_9ACTN|nr:MaoC family dehydratase N-terminal domain-containing protein [Frankia canadensis]SNQ47185.1 conserved hypothetical protein [Frankia canadensis]SOU54475.1 conserved hypothetical protein [Frankia canadensis]
MSSYTFPVESGQILLFARSVGYPDSAYADPSAGAPPTFVQSGAQYDPDYPLRPTPGEPWLGSGKTPSGAKPPEGGGGLHGEQHYVYHRPVRVGDVLTATTTPGKSWEKSGRRGGKMVFEEIVTEFRDAAGELVVTARAVRVIPSQVVESPAADAAAAR